MTTNTKIVLSVIGAVLAVAIIGAYRYPVRQAFVGAASAGATYTTGRAATQQIGVTSSSTVFSMQNNDGTGRVIKAADFFLQTGATTTTYTVACATSSTQFWPASANANVILQQSLQLIGAGTTTGSGLYFSSTSPGVTGLAVGTASTTARIWANGDWMVCKETSSPANDFFPASSNGVLSFPFSPGI